MSAGVSASCWQKNSLFTTACSCSTTHLTPRHIFAVFIEVVDVGAEGLEVWDDKLLPEGLGEQNNVALDTSETGDKATSG